MHAHISSCTVRLITELRGEQKIILLRFSAGNIRIMITADGSAGSELPNVAPHTIHGLMQNWQGLDVSDFSWYYF